jgi:hypothetical protein
VRERFVTFQAEVFLSLVDGGSYAYVCVRVVFEGHEHFVSFVRFWP